MDDSTATLLFNLIDSLHQNALCDTIVIKQSDGSSNLLLTWLPLLIALFAVIFGPIVTLCISKKQHSNQLRIAEQRIKADVNSKNRQEWINVLRDVVSEYSTSLIMLLTALQTNNNPEIEKQTERAIFLESKLKLMLNYNKPEQKKIIDLANIASDLINQGSQFSGLTDALGLLNSEVSLLLKFTWERVKNLE